MVRTLGVQVDDETYALFEFRRKEASERAGADISMSQLLRAVLKRDLGVSSNLEPFAEGWYEGFRAGYADVMRTTQQAMHDLEQEKLHTGELDPGRAGIAVNG